MNIGDKRRRAIADSEEDRDRQEAWGSAVHLPLPPTLDELRAQYLSPEMLKWKKEHPGQPRP